MVICGSCGMKTTSQGCFLESCPIKGLRPSLGAVANPTLPTPAPPAFGSKVVALAPKPTIAAEAKVDCVEILERMLAKAKAGEIDTVIVAVSRPNGNWMEEHSRAVSMIDVVGRLTIALHGWMDEYLAMSDVK